jgi:hypothetical protein
MADMKMKLILDDVQQHNAKEAYFEARDEAMLRADSIEAGVEFDRIADIAVREFIASLNANAPAGVRLALRLLQNAIEGNTDTGPFCATSAEIDRAREAYCDSSDNIEIDEVAFTSRGESGTWVQAWVWLPNNRE